MELTTTHTPQGEKEATMATSFAVSCSCCGTAVQASDAGFTATTVSVEACSSRKAAGMVTVTMRKSAAYAAAIPEMVLQHRDGLVAFG